MYNQQIPTLNVIPISEASKLFLTSCVPDIIFYGSSVGVEDQRMNLHSKSGWWKKGNITHIVIANKYTTKATDVEVLVWFLSSLRTTHRRISSRTLLSNVS